MSTRYTLRSRGQQDMSNSSNHEEPTTSTPRRRSNSSPPDIPSPKIVKEPTGQPEAEPEGHAGPSNRSASAQEEVQFWMRGLDVSSRDENHGAPQESSEVENTRGETVDQEPKGKGRQTEVPRGRQMRTQKNMAERGSSPELPKTLDEDAMNIGLQQQLLNSILEVNDEVLERIKEEAKERTYSDFLEWRERDRRERIETINSRDETVKPEKVAEKCDSGRQESVTVSNTMAQRIGQIAGEKEKLTEQTDTVAQKTGQMLGYPIKNGPYLHHGA
ncbi:hypothetical protein AAF712_015116 [Marasmius tenuissimus]|uniref:Uncharacterized protein n=1 Tax=Marasmius tenuissimus TaxID=585030 RepID=A0ABR2ZAB1_9AGAR